MSEATSPDQPEQITDKLIALPRGAHQNVDTNHPVDYWYRLGQRNAYAQAVGLVIARGADNLAFTIADRITNALSQGSTGVADLDRAAHGWDQLEPAGEAEPALTWLGPAAFQARYGDLPGIDHDFGTGWGAAVTSGSPCAKAPAATAGCCTSTTPPGTSTPSCSPTSATPPYSTPSPGRWPPTPTRPRRYSPRW